MRYVAWSLLALAVLVALPLASACADAGGPLAPGDYILIGDHSCSLAFVLVDENGIYFATAGHCVKVGEKVVDKNNKLVGLGAFHYLSPETGSETDGSPGQDFGLIRVDPSRYDGITPSVCGWGGPTGIYREKPGSGDVHHYGHGVLLGDISPKRSGTNLQNDNTAFYWLGDGLPGDSGSAVLAADGRALGVLTHLSGGIGTTNGGTHLDRGLKLAAEGGFPHLRLVLAGEDPVAMYRAMQADPTPASTSSPTPPVANGTGAAPSGNGGAANGSTNGTAPTSRPPSGPAGGEAETPGAVHDAPTEDGAAKRAPGPEAGLALASGVAAALALARRHRRRARP